MTDSFADYPPSITELRAHKSEASTDWTPRDALIDCLRAIDRGEYDPEALVIVMRRRKKDDEHASGMSWWLASPDHFVTLGLLSAALHDIASGNK